MQRIRNPSPPPNFTNFRSNMHIEFLKPLFSLQSIEVPIDLFNKNLFISSPETTHETTHETIASCDLENTPVPKNLQLISDTDLYEDRNEARYKTKESSKVKEPERARKKSGKSSKKHRSEKEPISSDDQRRHHKRTSSKHKKKYVPEDSDSDKVSKTKKLPKSYSHYRNVSESDSVDYYEKDSKKRSHKKYHKHKEYNYSDSSNESYSKSLRDYKRHKDYQIMHDASDSDRSVEADRYHSHRRDYRKEYDAFDSDRSRRSAEVDQHHRTSSKKDYVTLDSDRSKGPAEVDQHLRRSSIMDYDTQDSIIYEGPAEVDYHLRQSSIVDYVPLDSDRSDIKQECYNQSIKQEFVEDSDLPELKYDPYMEFKEEYNEFATFGPDTFYCKVCQLHLNGQATYESHMNGKKHKKNEKALMVPDILKGSISTLTLTKESLRPTSNPSNQIILETESFLQSILFDYTENPLIGLDYVKERRSNKDTTYYCELCDAPCMATSVIPHLIGSKHQLKFLKATNERFYESIKDRPGKEISEKIRQELFRHERKYGRGNITVVSIIEESKPVDVRPYSVAVEPEAGPSWRNTDTMQPQIKMMENPIPRIQGPFPDFDATKNDYYCKICDVHMNNFQMFESHRRGKRHLKNEKKTAAERHAQQMDSRAPPGTRSELEKNISKNDEDVIVGLNYIRETHSENGALYLCYICGSSGCDTVIIDHILSLKHRIKYLETVDENGMIPNAINSICELEVSSHNREALVLAECERIEKKYGRGTVEIYITKSAPDFHLRW